MTISSSVVQTAGSLGNGATTQFSFSFHIDDYGGTSAEDQITVIRETVSTGAEETLVRNTDYSVSINGDQDASPGGSITMLTGAPSSSFKIWIRLSPTWTQATDLGNQAPFNAQTIEDQMDQQQRMLNVLQDRMRRTPHVGIQAGTSFDGEMTGDLTAGYVPIVKQDLSGWQLGAPSSVAVSAAMTPVVQAASVEAGAANLGTVQVFNVKSATYGALGDGSTDDTAAFELADAAAAAAGGAMYAPPGTYILDNFTPSANTRLVGAGVDKSVLKHKANSGLFSPVVRINANGVTVEDLTVDGNSVNQINAAHNIQVENAGAYATTLRRLRSTDANGQGANFTSTGDDTQGTVSVVEGCLFDNNQDTGLLARNAYSLKMRGNVCRDNGQSGVGDGIKLFAVNTSDEGVNRHIEVTGNHCFDNAGCGILAAFTATHAQPSYDVIISHNFCHANGQYGIAGQGRRILINDNVCEDQPTVAFAGILFNVDEGECCNNICRGNTHWGIDGAGAEHSIVSGNIVIANGVVGINCGLARRMRYTNNVCANNGSVSGGVQMHQNRSDGSGLGIAGILEPSSYTVFEDNTLVCANVNQLGLQIEQNCENLVVRNNTAYGGDPATAFIIESESAVIEGNRHADHLGGYTIASAATLVLPDWVETALVTGTTAITELRTYTQNANFQKVGWVDVTNPGSGYTSLPTIGFTGGGGTGATGVAFISPDGEVAGIRVTNKGSGYTSAPTVSITGGGGTGAAATAHVGLNNVSDRKLLLSFAAAGSIVNGNNIFLDAQETFIADAGGDSVIALRGFASNRWRELTRSFNGAAVGGAPSRTLAQLDIKDSAGKRYRIFSAANILTVGDVGVANMLQWDVTIGARFNHAVRSVHATGGVGYATGAGGAVTQITSKATGVTLNKVCGQITMNGAALNAGTEVSFTLTDSAIAATDVVSVCIASAATAGAYAVTVDAVAAGSCRISLTNLSAVNLSEALVLNFAVTKAVAA